MYKGRRLYTLAAVGSALILLASVGYYRIQEAQTDAYPDARHQPARYPTEAVGGPRNQPVPPAYDPQCQNPQNREDSDLCAQWSAVEAMKEANRVTQTALQAGWFEFIALLVSISLTGWTAFAASRAARSAEFATRDADKALQIAARNADAAAQQVRISEETAKRQLRSYLRISAIAMPPPEQLPDGVARLKVNNYGRTPAMKVVLHGVTFLAPAVLPSDHVIEGSWTPIGEDLVVHPGEHFDFGERVKLAGPDDVASVLDDDPKRRLYVAVRAEYADVFGETHVEQICARASYAEAPLLRWEQPDRHRMST